MSQPPRLPDFVRESQLQAQFGHEEGSTALLTIHARPRREVWKRERVLGRGGFGCVWLEKLVSEVGMAPANDAYRAVKEIFRPREMPGNSMAMDYIRELEALAKFSQNKYSDCFVRSFGWYEDQTSLFVAMEYCVHGDLQQYVKKTETGRLKETEVLDVTRQVLEGLNFMHEEGFAHRDLKPANILIISCPPKPWWVKICDLGISKRIEGLTWPSSTLKCTPGFIPPELLPTWDGPSRAPSRGSDPFAADIWCLGETIFRMLAGRPTFTERDLRHYESGRIPFPVQTLHGVVVSPEAVDFIQLAMKSQPDHRIKAKDALTHRWVMPRRGSPESQRHSSAVDLCGFDQPMALSTNANVTIATEPFASGEWSAVTNTVPPDQSRSGRLPHVESTTGEPLKRTIQLAESKSQDMSPDRSPGIPPPRVKTAPTDVKGQETPYIETRRKGAAHKSTAPVVPTVRVQAPLIESHKPAAANNRYRVSDQDRTIDKSEDIGNDSSRDTLQTEANSAKNRINKYPDNEEAKGTLGQIPSDVVDGKARSPEKPNIPRSDGDKHRRQSRTESTRSGALRVPLRTPRPDRGFSADSSGSSGRRRRTPEEQAAHDKRKAERAERPAAREAEYERDSTSSDALRVPPRTPRRDRGFSADSSGSSGRRRRTPEEQAAHDKRKAERAERRAHEREAERKEAERAERPAAREAEYERGWFEGNTVVTHGERGKEPESHGGIKEAFKRLLAG
ncbi:hypothetical protein FOMA001_g17881 [Fusarium oxysporum f. sp. matthiolae]|nr:hypothetical protein FOMA001_g17881 [Fusarium oxysporum f. sp. matthiolae]